MILTYMIPEQEMIFYAPGIPGTYRPVQGTACVHAEEKFGSIEVEELTHETFTIQLSDYYIKQYAVLKGVADKPLPELQVALLNSFRKLEKQFPVITELLKLINNKQPGLLCSADTLTAVIYDILWPLKRKWDMRRQI